MPEVPSFLNRTDFISFMLPGYVTIISYLILFKPTILQTSVSFDIFSSVVFVVAGPSLGITLQLFQRGLNLIPVTLDSKKRAEYAEFVIAYASVRVRMSSDEKLELEQAEAFYDFCMSTCLGVALLSLYGFYALGCLQTEPWVMVVIAIILSLNGYLHQTRRYRPLLNFLTSKYGLEPKKALGKP